jgi:curved DNA-binding protein CbpA
MREDPAGHYATLGLDPAAPAEAVVAAFRAAARRFHPDVPETGDAEAFVRARAAYDVLGDADRRAAYDRAARSVDPAPAPVGPDTLVRDTVVAAWRRPSGLSLGLFAGCAGFALLALAIGFAGLAPSGSPTPIALPTGTPSRPVAPVRAPRAPPAPVEGIASGYILPAGGAATLWRPAPAAGSSEGRYVPVGQLAAFTPVAIRRVDAQHGMVEVAASNGSGGFIYASRLAPGDAAAAERARCIYEAGAPPANSEILARRGSLGDLRVVVENRRDQPAVVKLRDKAGVAVASVFVAPRAVASIEGLPPGDYRPEFAFGELWSHACRRFVAGMRAQRFAAFQPLDESRPAEARYTIPPSDGIDEPDDEFNRD